MLLCNQLLITTENPFNSFVSLQKSSKTMDLMQGIVG